MRVNFEFEWKITSPNLKQKAKDLRCWIRGRHNYKKYREPQTSPLAVFYDKVLLSNFFGSPEAYRLVASKQCTDCGKIIYKKVFKKPQTIKFKRYAPLKSIKPKK